MSLTNKRISLYKRLAQLVNALTDEAEQPIDAYDIPGAEFRLHAAHVIDSLNQRKTRMLDAMTSDEQSEVYKWECRAETTAEKK